MEERWLIVEALEEDSVTVGVPDRAEMGGEGGVVTADMAGVLSSSSLKPSCLSVAFTPSSHSVYIPSIYDIVEQC